MSQSIQQKKSLITLSLRLIQPPPPSSSSQYDSNNQANQEVGVYKSINTSINTLLNVLPRAAIIGSTCQLIVSFLPYWLSGNDLAEVISYVHFTDIEKDAGLLHLCVVGCNK